MRCLINFPDGKRLPFIFNRQDKISKIKSLIAKEIEIPKDKIIHLIYLGKQLENSLTFYDYDVKDNGSLLLFFGNKQKKKEDTDSNLFNNSNYKDNKFSDASASKGIEKPTLDSQGNVVSLDTEGNATITFVDGEKVVIPVEEENCNHCDNKNKSQCKECGCNICGNKDQEASILICDECQYYFHMFCLPKPLKVVPEGDWYCPSCYNDPNIIIKGGEVNKIKIKKEIKRKWDNGMACAGVTKKCTIVKPDHVGAIPGVPVGSSFRYRVGLSESGVHRPPVAGIHGSEKTRAYSIVLAGGYEDDKDFGDYFYYTGSGGRDLSGNKRTAKQSSNQELKRTNLALAKTMNQPIKEKEGDVAKDWKKSSPVRVSRSYKLKKDFPEYAPDEGIRYDGLYKLVRYWSEVGETGFVVWRYEFRRDDPEPAPWTPEGKQRIKELGLVMYDPTDGTTQSTPSKSKTKGKNKGQRRKTESSSSEIGGSEEENEIEKKTKKSCLSNNIEEIALNLYEDKGYKLDEEILKLIKMDIMNQRIWSKVLNLYFPTLTAFLDHIVGTEFVCSICHDLVQSPVTSHCSHNTCLNCLKNSLIHFGNNCPLCRSNLYPELEGMDKKKIEKRLRNKNEPLLCINNSLVEILKRLVPSYST